MRTSMLIAVFLFAVYVNIFAALYLLGATGIPLLGLGWLAKPSLATMLGLIAGPLLIEYFISTVIKRMGGTAAIRSRVQSGPTFNRYSTRPFLMFFIPLATGFILLFLAAKKSLVA